jgi:membrane protein implicated in regulation of membrane protease activity
MGFMITSTTMYIIWAVAIVAFGVLEGMTAQLVSIWFVFGSITGLIAAICGAPIILQVIIFVLVTIITLIATRPIVKKKLNTKVQPTNADRCIGQDGVVIEEINNLAPSGQVKADGKIWTARSFDQSVTV